MVSKTREVDKIKYGAGMKPGDHTKDGAYIEYMKWVKDNT